MSYSQTNSKGQQYFLHMKDVTLKGGRLQRIHFFAREIKPDKGTPLDAIPTGFVTIENPRTGLIVLKKAVPATA